MTKPRVCEVHGTALEWKRVPIHYGYPAYDNAWAVQERLFPHSHSYSLGGCLVSEDDPKSERQLVCIDCRESEKKWRADHLKPDGDLR